MVRVERANPAVGAPPWPPCLPPSGWAVRPPRSASELGPQPSRGLGLGLLVRLFGGAVLTTIGIIASLAFDAFRFFQHAGDRVPGTNGARRSQLRRPGRIQRAPSSEPCLFAGTLLIMLIAMLVAAPIGLLSAIYLSEYAAGSPACAVIKPALHPGWPAPSSAASSPPRRRPALRLLQRSALFRSAGRRRTGPAGLALVQNQMASSGAASWASCSSCSRRPRRDPSSQCGAAKPARRLLRHGRPSPETVKRVLLPRRLAGHRRALLLAVLQHRRDHDRDHGRRPGRQPDLQTCWDTVTYQPR